MEEYTRQQKNEICAARDSCKGCPLDDCGARQ